MRQLKDYLKGGSFQRSNVRNPGAQIRRAETPERHRRPRMKGYGGPVRSAPRAKPGSRKKYL